MSFEVRLEEHMKSDELALNRIDTRLTKIETNHLYHIEQDLRRLADSVKDNVLPALQDLHKKVDDNTTETIENKTNIKWLQWGMMLIGSALVTGVATLFFKMF